MSSCRSKWRPAAAASTSSSPRYSSTDPVGTLIDAACSRQEAAEIIDAFSPLFPEASPWALLADIPEACARRLAPQRQRIAQALEDYREGLTATAGRLARWLDASEEDIRQLALDFARYTLPGTQKIRWASRLLMAPVPGKTPDSQLARVNDARFWRRAIRTVLLREREHFYLRLSLIGRSQEAYASDRQVQTRRLQLKRQQQWMKETVLVPRYLEPGESEALLTLDQVAANPRTRFAKTYTFIKAMEAIAHEQGLVSAMVTLTAPPEWHPNPSHGENSWNGQSPRDAHRYIAQGWHACLIAWHKKGIGVSGLRVVEPHQDGCPHWHIWLIYRPDVETQLLAALMRQFPGKLKRRAPSRKGETTHSRDVMFETRGDILAGTGRPLKHPKEGAQVEFSRIDPSISSGASYAMKYLLKTVDGGEPLNRQVDLFGDAVKMPLSDEETAACKTKRLAHQKTARRVDAWRSLWGINAGMLFGVARCLSAWDELRRLTTKPSEPTLFKLWVLARGSDKEGHIAAGSGERGDAKEFLCALGGLAAARDPCAKPKTTIRLGRLTKAGINGYGEAMQRTQGVQLIETRQISRTVPGKRAGRTKTLRETRLSVLASVVTRLREWVLAPQKRAEAAIARAQAYYHAYIDIDSRENQQKRARQMFWTRFHEAMAAAPPELLGDRLTRRPHP